MMNCPLCNQDHRNDVACSMTRIQEFKRSKQAQKAEFGDITPPTVTSIIEIYPIVVEQNSKNKFDRSAFMKERHRRKSEEKSE